MSISSPMGSYMLSLSQAYLSYYWNNNFSNMTFHSHKRTHKSCIQEQIVNILGISEIRKASLTYVTACLPHMRRCHVSFLSEISIPIQISRWLHAKTSAFLCNAVQPNPGLICKGSVRSLITYMCEVTTMGADKLYYYMQWRSNITIAEQNAGNKLECHTCSFVLLTKFL